MRPAWLCVLILVTSCDRSMPSESPPTPVPQFSTYWVAEDSTADEFPAEWSSTEIGLYYENSAQFTANNYVAEGRALTSIQFGNYVYAKATTTAYFGSAVVRTLQDSTHLSGLFPIPWPQEVVAAANVTLNQNCGYHMDVHGNHRAGVYAVRVSDGVKIPITEVSVWSSPASRWQPTCPTQPAGGEGDGCDDGGSSAGLTSADECQEYDCEWEEWGLFVYYEGQ